MRRQIFIFVLVLLISGCGGGGGGGGDGPSSLACPRIAGGEQCNGGSAVVQLISADFSGRESSCSATMITANQALTAGHCFYGLGIQASRAKVGDTNYQVSKIAIHPQYRGRIGQDTDLAIVTFVSAVPRPTLPLLVDDIFELVAAEGTKIRAVGYGFDESGGIGALKSADMIITGTDPNQYLFFASQFGQDAAGSTCSGDSGGPAILTAEEDGSEGVLGVVSYGPVGCDASLFTAFVALHDIHIYSWLFEQAPGAVYF